MPPGDLPEVAFAGRSNVGKSSLINALVGQEGLARTSNTPGRTQQVNMFELDGRLRLVDLPGYGYAQAPKKLVESWNRLIFAYLRGRPCLQRALVLVDARHGLKATDEEAMADALAEWPIGALRFPRGDIRSPFEVEQLARTVRPEDFAGRMVVSSDPDVHRANLQRHLDLGFTRIYLHNAGRDQARFLEVFGRDVLPGLRA